MGVVDWRTTRATRLAFHVIDSLREVKVNSDGSLKPMDRRGAFIGGCELVRPRKMTDCMLEWGRSQAKGNKRCAGSSQRQQDPVRPADGERQEDLWL